jgi:hypothetical protein
MNNKLTWLSTSLFCLKSQWDELFSNGIVPFLLDNQQANALLEAYSIEFNYSGGENIRLSLLTLERNANDLTKKTQEYFTAYFLKSNYLLKESTSFEKNTSGSFPINTIQFGLYPSLNITRKEKKNHSLSINLSRIILEGLKNDCINDENILSFAFYLQMGLIKIMKDIDPDFINMLKSEFIMQSIDLYEKDRISFSSIESLNSKLITGEINMSDYLIQQDIVINEKFEANKEILFEIAKEIMEPNAQSNSFSWIEKWLIICKNEIDKAGQNNILTARILTNRILTSIYIRLIRAIYQHLGIATRMNVVFTYFVQRVLGLVNPPNAIVMGAQKCGTTTLHYSLAAHSKINGPVKPENSKRIKEVDFFYNPKRWEKGLAWYFSHFTGVNGLFLDSSPNYLALPGCFWQMQSMMPNAKLIICLRDPVYRAYSQYNHYTQDLPDSTCWDWKYEKDFLTNIKMELQDIETMLHQSPNTLESETSFSGFLLRGVYIHQITQLLNYYDRSQIYISITDHWHLNYKNELDNILTFLELEKEELPPIIRHKRSYTVEPFDNEAKEILTEFYKPYNHKLFEFLGHEIPQWRH